MLKKTIKKLERENEKLRSALVECLMPLHLVSKHLNRPGMINQIRHQAKESLVAAQAALNFDAEDMAVVTDTEEDIWNDIEEFLATHLKENDDEED